MAPPLAQVLRPLQTEEYFTTGAHAAVNQELERGKGWCDVLHHDTVHCHHEVLSVPGPTVDRRMSVNSGAAGKEATTYVLTCVS